MKTRATVRLYTKPGCHLCEEAKAEMLKAGCADDYVLEEINIETDPALFERYRFEIPVITINDVKAFKYHVTPNEFRKKVKRAVTDIDDKD